MKQTLLVTLLLFAAYASNAQRATVRGTVLDRASGEPVIFTNVLLRGTQYGAQTDENGFYSIPSVPAGTYTLFCTYLSYDTFQLDITLRDNDLV
ncbi:MAG TPA: carboxypeptidase-like regulatory domain-containing protein, partial [Chitinophagales bacterium]|nr:carboxypeptidase-like regulatory domain-containing protein [Chitinophagales bacterium]